MRDRHHILNYRQEWSLRPEGLSIRERPTLIPRIERTLHNHIHDQVPFVPMLGYHALRLVAREFDEKPTTLKSIDSLLLTMDKAASHEKNHPIEVAQIRLAQLAIELQRDILKAA